MNELLLRMKEKCPGCWIWSRSAEVVKAAEVNGYFFAIARYKIGSRWRYISGVMDDGGLYATPNRDPGYDLEHKSNSLAEAKRNFVECITIVKESYLHV